MPKIEKEILLKKKREKDRDRKRERAAQLTQDSRMGRLDFITMGKVGSSAFFLVLLFKD